MECFVCLLGKNKKSRRYKQASYMYLLRYVREKSVALLVRITHYACMFTHDYFQFRIIHLHADWMLQQLRISLYNELIIFSQIYLEQIMYTSYPLHMNALGVIHMVHFFCSHHQLMAYRVRICFCACRCLQIWPNLFQREVFFVGTSKISFITIVKWNDCWS